MVIHGRRWPIAAGVFFWLMVMGSAATGQEVPPDVGAADRPRPEYDPIGIRTGAFFIYPAITIGSSYTDNLLAREENTISDYALGVAPELRVESDWARHSLEALVYSESAFYANTSRMNYTNWGAEGQGRLDVLSSTSIEAGAAYDKRSQRPGNINTAQATKHRIVYDVASGQIGIQQTLNRLDFLLQGQIQNVDFDDAELQGGGVLDQDFRDRTEMEGLFQTTYAISPGYGAFIEVTVNRRNYALSPGDPDFVPGEDFDRDSHGYRLETGLAFELTNLLYGHIGVGYINQNYQDPAFADVSAPSFGADLLWNVTTLTSIRFTGTRQANDSTSPNSGARLMTEVGLGVDHELLRNLIVTLDGGYRNQKFTGTGRSDNYYQMEGGVRYLFSPTMTFEAGYQFRSRSSTRNVQEYSQNVVEVGMTLHL
ncbi:MAG: outer membrane beta-barrel protein [Nitrococcus sp.]|nr:outer membrane beta-barrel protein [Nitrococcus sp.]